MKITRRAFSSSLAALTTLAAAPNLRIEAASTTFSSWPEGTSPREIGSRVADRFVATPHTNFGRLERPHSITYPETCTWYGALTFARLAKNKALTRKLIARFDSLFGPDADLIPTADHVDPSVFGAVPFELYIQTHDKRYLDIGTPIAERQWSAPTPDGLSPQTRFWIDDMYMITALQAQAFRATGKREYIDRAAREMVVYLEKLQQPNGLFYHAPDVPFFWGRGNGWMAAGMTELLRSLPKHHPQRAAIMAGYQKMLATLMTYQDSNGAWRQLIDRPEAWPESSCTGMFTFAMVTGVKEGWLDARIYAPAARRAWLGLIQFINDDAEVREVCEGTNKMNDYQYYLDRKRNIGDLHGQAPVLWSAAAFLR